MCEDETVVLTDEEKSKILNPQDKSDTESDLNEESDSD